MHQSGGRFSGSGDRELREQLLKEIENKSRSCANTTYYCSIPRIDGFDYCIRHILRGAANSYRQCTYIYMNGRKCPNALMKHDTKKDPALTTLCFEHSRHAQLQKTRATIGKLRRNDSNETLLNGIAHHLNVEKVPPIPTPKLVKCEDEEIDVVSPYVPQFVNTEQIHELTTVAGTIRKRRRILDYASDSSSNDDDLPCMLNTSQAHDYESDNESIDSLDHDPLKHAGIYTRQEAIRIAEAKLTRLQSLYMGQITRLHYVLKERRRIYLQAIRKERETLCSIHDQLKETTRERHLYEQLKALNTYHRRHGIEAVLYKKFKEKRNRANDTFGHGRGPGTTKCIFTEGGVKCGVRTMPFSKFCKKHILEDKKQTLFRCCGVEKSGVVCQEAVPSISDDATCVLHLIVRQRQYIQKKYESETDDDEQKATTKPILKPKIEKMDECGNDDGTSTNTTTTASEDNNLNVGGNIRKSNSNNRNAIVSPYTNANNSSAAAAAAIVVGKKPVMEESGNITIVHDSATIVEHIKKP